MNFFEKKPGLYDSTHLSLLRGTRILACARGIRWVGWGLGESLIPIFIVTFSHTYAQMGLFSSMVEIVALFSLPIIGIWADKMPARNLVLWGLILYPLVGISYFFAGVFGAALFVVLARAINGFTWSLENVGTETYFRRAIHHSNIATSFGALDTWSNAAWICAAAAGMILVSYIPVHYLLLGISPFALIAFLVASRAPKDLQYSVDRSERRSFIRSYGRAITEWRSWDARLRLLSALVLFTSVISAIIDFFLPIDAYLSGANLPMVVLLAIFAAAPSLFGYKLGRLVDTRNKYRLIAYGLAIIAIVMSGIVIFPQFYVKLAAVFIMGIVLELFNVAKGSLVTTLGPAATYGIRGSAFESIVTFGDLTAPLIIGVTLDILGFEKLAYTISAVSIFLAVMYCFRKWKA